MAWGLGRGFLGDLGGGSWVLNRGLWGGRGGGGEERIKYFKCSVIFTPPQPPGRTQEKNLIFENRCKTVNRIFCSRCFSFFWGGKEKKIRYIIIHPKKIWALFSLFSFFPGFLTRRTNKRDTLRGKEHFILQQTPSPHRTEDCVFEWSLLMEGGGFRLDMSLLRAWARICGGDKSLRLLK